MALHLPTIDRTGRDGPSTPAGMPLLGHLTELRNRLLISAAAVTVGAIVVFVLFNHVLGALLTPLLPHVGTEALLQPLRDRTPRRPLRSG